MAARASSLLLLEGPYNMCTIAYRFSVQMLS